MKKIILLLAMGAALTTQTLFAQVPSYVPTNGLVGYWPFNGNANDISGNGNNGTVNGATLTTDRNGDANSAYDFNGINNDINFGSSTVFGLTSNNILTFSVWVRPMRASNNANIMDGVFSKYQDLNVSNSNYYFSIDKNVSSPSNPPIGVITSNGTNSIGTTCELNAWQHYVIVMQSGLNNIKVYRNGVLDNTGTVNFSSLISNSNLYLGYIPTSATNITQSNFLGKIDDFGIWNRALTQQEITTMYNSIEVPTYSDTCNNVSGSLTQGLVGYWPFCGNANDDSGNGNNGTVNGATLTTDRFGNTNSAYDFNGTTNYISVMNNSSLNPSSITISGWISSNANAQNTSGGVRSIVTKWNQTPNCGGDGENFNVQLSVFNSTNVIAFATSQNSQIANALKSSTDVIGLNTWKHFVFTHDPSSGQKLYINGVLISSNNTLGVLCATTNNLYFGADKLNAALWRYFNGKIDDIGIWNRALTPSEVTQLYNQNQCSTNITVTDTLIINVGQLSYTNPIAYANNIIIAPNPASTQININFNNITDLNGGTLKVINSLGQEVATTPITTSGTNSTMQLETWGGTGMYFVQIINPQGQIVDIKKIILQ
jgi:hypothetical protein